MKTKAFTLIELLAVIVILAIIALIATPIILGIIDDTKLKSRLISFDNIEHAAELYVTTEVELNKNELNKAITLRELKELGYIDNTNEDLNNRVFITNRNNKYSYYYEGRDNLEDYKTLKELIDEDHIKEDVVINGQTVDKIYGEKSEQTTMNNYVVYSGQLWEVVEFNNTNNTIKLVSPVSLTSIAYGTTNVFNDSWVNKWLNTTFYNILERTDLIVPTTFCIDKIDVNPEEYTKMTSCTNTITTNVGLLTYEDYIYAKTGDTIVNGGSFLDEDELSWTITPSSTTNKIWYTDYSSTSDITLGPAYDGGTYYTNYHGLGVRPVISIKDSVLVKSGEGTRSNPYILSSERYIEEESLNMAKVGDYVYIDESENPYVEEISETTATKVARTTTIDKVRYRIVNINDDGTIKLERADILRYLPSTIAVRSNVYIPFYSIDGGSSSTSCMYDTNLKYGSENTSSTYYYIVGCYNHNIFNPNEGNGDFNINEGDSLPYYLNNADNSFYNWYSDAQKKMIVKTRYNLYTNGLSKDYSNLNDNPNATYPNNTNDGEVEVNVGLPYWGEMYTGNDLNTPYWLINRYPNSLHSVSHIRETGGGGGTSTTDSWRAARPVITLSSKTLVNGGTGTVVDPYTLSL